jgi:hypothetical protein
LAAFMKRRYQRVRMVVESSVEISKLEQERASPSAIQAHTQAAHKQLSVPY